MKQPRAKQGKRTWLVMFYMAADNNLTEDMVLAMQDLAAVGPPAGYRIVAQFDPSGLGVGTQRYDFNTRPPAGAFRNIW